MKNNLPLSFNESSWPTVRTPIMAHQPSKTGVQAQTLTFPDGPKVITQPAQGPPVALTHISGLPGITTQKGQVTTHTLQQQQQHQHQQHQQQQQQHHSTGVQHRGT